MKKVVFTFGDFDCMDYNHYHLIKEMRKICLPDKEVIALVIGDYASFVLNKKFPVQRIDHRKNNLSYFLGSIRDCATDGIAEMSILISICKQENSRLIYVGYEDEKDFPGVNILKENGVSLRFIKRPKQYEVKTTEEKGS